MLLGNAQEAARELDGLDEAHRLDFDVLLLHARICRHREDWTRMLNIGRLLVDIRPERAAGVLTLAAATRHLHGPDRALGILMDALEDFPHEAAVVLRPSLLRGAQRERGDRARMAARGRSASICDDHLA